ncbi:MAG: hypothetical protein PHZ03_01410 [Syntrophomonas sp.]|nr:hypothetical protein [Syntrophomonas sp.]
MLKCIETSANIVITSRFIPGGEEGVLNLIHELVSATTLYIGKALLKKLFPISDSTRGFFMSKCCSAISKYL